MLTPAVPVTGDRVSASQARALRGLHETLDRHPRARIYARLARRQRPSVVAVSARTQPSAGLVAMSRLDDRVAGLQPRVSDQVIRRRFRLSWLDG